MMAIVAMDAQVIQSFSMQMDRSVLDFELRKAYCGFMRGDVPVGTPLPAVATGNWGCGAFGGDTRVKFIIQVLAASLARRSLAYFTFHDTYLRNSLRNFYMALRERHATTGTGPVPVHASHRQRCRPPYVSRRDVQRKSTRP